MDRRESSFAILIQGSPAIDSRILVQNIIDADTGGKNIMEESFL